MMKKIFISFFLSILMILSFPIVSADSASVSFQRYSKDAKLSFDNLKDYNILLTDSENGISNYSGLKGNIHLTFEANENEVNKIIFLFDFDVGEAKRAVDMMEIIEIASNLMPEKIQSLTEAQDKLYKKLAALKMGRDKDVFMIDRLRFECNINNGMINLRVTK